MNNVRVKILSGLLAVVVLGIAIASVWVLFIKDDNSKNTSDDVGFVVSQPVSYLADYVQLEVNINGTQSVSNANIKKDEPLIETLKRYDTENTAFKLEYTQYDFGAFVTSLYGTTADSNTEFFSLQINGAESSVGVSDYKVQPGDKITFVLTKFN